MLRKQQPMPMEASLGPLSGKDWLLILSAAKNAYALERQPDPILREAINKLHARWLEHVAYTTWNGDIAAL